MFDDYYYDDDPEADEDHEFDDDPEFKEYQREEKISEIADLWEANNIHLPEDKWLYKRSFDCNMILKHKFYNGEESRVVVFGIDGDENGTDMTLNYISRDKILDEDLRNGDLIVKGTVDAAYAVVEDVIKHFDNSQINEDEFALYLANQVKRNNENFGNNMEKTLIWEKKLGEQSEYVKKVIEPFLTSEMAYNSEYSQNEERKNFWEAKGREDPNYVKDYILKELFPNNLCDELRRLNYANSEMRAVDYLKSLGIENIIEYAPEPIDRQLETAQKTGYVQGVCESVLAFNTDENRKIMSESTMAFLSKKLLSEMNVTKDMARKFANPETYKALEQCVFAPKQEQHLEQTQSQGRGM